MLNKSEKFIVGLGNPGKKYCNSRHNVGFLLIQELINKYSSNLILKNKLKCFYSEFNTVNSIYRLFMPNTFMNNSGDSVRAIIDWFKIDNKQIIVIVDDIDLPLGKIRFREKGSSGGHNGLKSIISQLNTNEFKRIRVGIGSPKLINAEKKISTISHVLGDLSKPEKLILRKIFCKIIESLENFNEEKIDSIICSLNSFNAT